VKATDAAGRTAIRTAEVAPAPGNLAPQAEWITYPIGFPDPNAMGNPLFLAGRATSFGGWGDDVDGGGCCAVAWDGDGDGAYDDGTVNSLDHTFGAGQHTVGLRATDADGAVAELRRTFTVGTRSPEASFSVADSILTSTSTDPDGDPIASVEWDLDGDRAFDDARGPSARALEGEHLVGMRATDAGGDIGISYERVTGGPPPAAAPAATPAPVVEPAQKLRIATSVKAPKLSALLARGLTLTVRCTAACRTTVVATVDKATAKGLKLRSRELGRGSAKGGTVRVSLTARARKALRRTRSVRLTLTIAATGADGSRTAVTKALTVRR
jgi:hypothetical protein